MQYEDEIRQYNFLSGLVAGALVGTGLALLVPSARGMVRRRRKKSWRQRGAKRLGALRDGVSDPAVAAIQEARRRFAVSVGQLRSG